MVDPNLHADLLAALNSGAETAEDLGRRFQKVLADEMESAIKELSSCLLYPNAPIGELNSCVGRFGQALEHMVTAQKNLDAGIARVQQLNEQFPTH